MFNTHPNKRKHWPYKRDGDGHLISRSRLNHNLSPEQVAKLMLKQPELRLADNPANVQLAQLLMIAPEDRYVQDLFQLVTRDGLGKAVISNDTYLGNYWPKGSISYPDDFLKLGLTPMSDSVGIIISQLTGNILLIGRSKSAKTSLLISLLLYPELLKTVRIVVFAKKRELRHLATIPSLRDFITIFKLEELVLCYFEPPPGVPEEAWNNESVRIPAQCYGRYSAQRLMGDKVRELMANHPKSVYPTLRQLTEILEAFKPRFGMREAAYKESILWCIKDLLNNTGNIWEYSCSDFLEQLYSEPGLCIIEAEALPQDHLTFVATYFMRWLYLKRVFTGEIVT